MYIVVDALESTDDKKLVDGVASSMGSADLKDWENLEVYLELLDGTAFADDAE